MRTHPKENSLTINRKTNTFRHAVIAGTLALAATLVSPLAAGDEIKIGGTGNALGTMRLLGDAYMRKYPEAKVIVLSSLGSSGALKAVPKGAIDIGLASRPTTDEERAAGAVAAEYARSATVFAVAKTNEVSAITRQQYASILTGQLSEWPGGQPIRPILRQMGDDNTKQVRSLSPEIATALDVADRREGLARAVTDQDAADRMEHISGAIGVSTLALIKSEARALKALALDGVEPTLANGASGAYPLVKHFYFVTRPARSAAVQKFIDFVGSREGRDVLAQSGHWLP